MLPFLDSVAHVGDYSMLLTIAESLAELCAASIFGITSVLFMVIGLYSDTSSTGQLFMWSPLSRHKPLSSHLNAKVLQIYSDIPVVH